MNEIAADRVRSGETLPGGASWSRRLRRHEVLRLLDTTGSACVSALLYNARDPLERYNMADTLKGQYTAFLTAGRALYSDMGRVLASITSDGCGWHDTISGHGDAVAMRARFGEGSYQTLRNEFHRNARDNFLIGLGKYGLGKRDLVANVNFFARVIVDEAGRISWSPGNSRAGTHVDLRFEMDTLVILSNTPHPLDPATSYGPPAVRLTVSSGDAPGPDDPCRRSRPENERAFALTEAYVQQVQELRG